MSSTHELLTKGLIQGYVSSEPPMPIIRGGFRGKSTHFEDETGIYHDEWFGKTSGGGQELVRTEKGVFLRTYYGGTAPEEILSVLGITADDVGEYLVKKLKQLGDKTRLDTDSGFVEDGAWQYEYAILDEGEVVKYLSASEIVLFKGTRVHFHHFGLTPVR